MEGSHWPKKIYQWTPHSRRRRGRPQQSWKNQVMDFLRSQNQEDDVAKDRYVWRLGVNGQLLAVEILIIILIILFSTVQTVSCY